MTKLANTLAVVLTTTAIAALPVAAQDAINPDGISGPFAGRPYSPYADRAFPTNVYFGDTHVHTGAVGGRGRRRHSPYAT